MVLNGLEMTLFWIEGVLVLHLTNDSDEEPDVDVNI